MSSLNVGYVGNEKRLEIQTVPVQCFDFSRGNHVDVMRYDEGVVVSRCGWYVGRVKLQGALDCA